MTKINRPDADVKAFASESQTGERYAFATTTETDDLTLNLNTEWKRGWAVGTDPVNSAPPMEWFSGGMFTTSQLVSYLFQMGISEWNFFQFYPEKARAIDTNGNVWVSLQDHSGQVQQIGLYWKPESKKVTFDDIDTLRSNPGAFQGQAANVLGYYTAGGSGGGPTRTWDEGQIIGFYVDNGGSIIVPTGGDGSAAWLMPTTDHYFLDEFGAKGNDEATDTAAMNTLVALTMDTGIIIKGLSKTYILNEIDVVGTGGTTPGNSGFRFEGVGDNSPWAALNALGGTQLKAADGAAYIFKFGDPANTVYRPSFKNVAFDGNNNLSDGVWMLNTGYAHFENFVFANCKGAFIPQDCDRMTHYKGAFYSNTYGYYIDEAIHNTGKLASAAVTLQDIHFRLNDYNLYNIQERSNFKWNIYGGYWSSGKIADMFTTAGWLILIFDGVNFENTTDASNATKDAYFQIGQVSAGDHIGIDLIRFVNCPFADNNGVGLKPKFMSVVDSLDNSNPSLRVLDISHCSLRSIDNPIVVKDADNTTEIDSLSEINDIVWWANEAPSTVPPIDQGICSITAKSTSAGMGQFIFRTPVMKFPEAYEPSLNRTSAFNIRSVESGGFYSNTGAAITQVHTLPPVELGLSWDFICTEATRKVRIAPQGDEGFLGGNGLGKYVELSVAVGDTVKIRAVSLTKAEAWVATILQGSLIYEP